MSSITRWRGTGLVCLASSLTAILALLAFTFAAFAFALLTFALLTFALLTLPLALLPCAFALALALAGLSATA